MALSGDGDGALIGETHTPGLENIGSAWPFTRAGSTWTPQGEAIVSGEQQHYENFGLRVALSRRGNVALVSHLEPFDHAEGEFPLPAGAWAFVRSGASWTKQIPQLPCAGEACPQRHQGAASVALSGDASTALVGTAVYVK